jgi:hypothetical protein
MLQWILLIVFNLFVSLPAEPKPGPSPAVKTSDLIIVSGGHSQERLKPENLLTIDGQKNYVVRTFTISRRANSNTPQEFKIWSRGLGDLHFFELPPATVPAQAFGNDASASQFISTLRSNGQLTPRLNVNILPGEESKLIGYVQRINSDNGTKAGGEILIAATNAEPDKLTVALEVTQDDTLLSKVWAAIPTTLVGLVGTLGGAIIGYKFFLFQQQRLRQLELEKKFADKKVEMSKTIRNFFTDDYDTLRQSQDGDLDKVKQIRDTLIERNIYAILLPEEVRELNKISDQNQPIAGNRVDAMHTVLERNFAELMA